PDAHLMVEASYNETKVVGVSPYYDEYEKFADLWLPAKAGIDAPLVIAMTHVILTDFYVKKETPYFIDYVKRFTDLPFLITVDDDADDCRSGRFLRSSDIVEGEQLGDWKTVVLYDESNNLEDIKLTQRNR